MSFVQALVRHPIARKLPLAFDPIALRSDLSGIRDEWWRGHLGPYHDGGWESVSLWAPRGDLYEQRSVGGPFASTAALERSPNLQRVLETLPGVRGRARLMRLRAGGRIFRHSDPVDQAGQDLVRLHIPITTNPDVLFIVADRRLAMQPSEVWQVDVRFPHEVRNAGTEARVHLVVDLHRDERLTALLARSDAIARGFLTVYYLKHALPARLQRRFGVGN